LLRGLLHPFGYPFRVTLKGESRVDYVIQWKVLGGLAALGLVTATGMVLNFRSVGSWNLLWDINMPIIMSLSVYVFWMLFLAALVCIERPNPTGGLDVEHAVTEGSFVKTLGAICRRVLFV